MVGGLEGCFKQTWELAEKIEKSKLTPMQKLHAMRTKLVPMLYHLLENSDTTLNQLERFNRAFRKMAKRILFLPEYAANAYIHLHRMYGGAGLPDLPLLKAKFVLQSLLAALNLKDELGSYTQKFLLRNRSIDEFIDAINNSRRSGLSKLGKEVISALLKIKQYLRMDIKINKFDNKIGLKIDNRNMTQALESTNVTILDIFSSCPPLSAVPRVVLHQPTFLPQEPRHPGGSLGAAAEAGHLDVQEAESDLLSLVLDLRVFIRSFKLQRRHPWSWTRNSEAINLTSI